eukprot:14543324-Ditylum_brightwellii.AAC.1
MLTTLAKVLAVMGYEDDKVAIATEVIGLMRIAMMIRRDTLLMNSSLSPGMIDEIMYLKMWYMQWRKDGTGMYW